MKNAEEKIEHVGGGFYELSDGSKEQGKEAAIEKQKELDEDKEPDNVTLDNGIEIEVTLWKDFKNYQCPVCPHSDLEFQRLKDHAVNRHSRKELERRKELNTDRHGNEIS